MQPSFPILPYSFFFNAKEEKYATAHALVGVGVITILSFKSHVCVRGIDMRHKRSGSPEMGATPARRRGGGCISIGKVHSCGVDQVVILRSS